MRRLRSFLGAVTMLAAATVARAEVLPHDEPRTLTEMAELVVEGRWIEGDGVEIVRTHVASRRVPEGTRRITVAGLGALDRRVSPAGPGAAGTAPLAARDVVLFADFDAEKGVWRAIHTMSGGSQGVWWLDGERVLRYEQWMNPGGYQLAEWRPRGPEDPCARPEDVRAAISTGIAARDLLARWGARYGQGDDADRLLIEYLGLPCLGRMDEIHTTGVVTRLLREQDGSVWPLARALRSAPDAGARRRILRVLADFGARAKPVAHEIVTLLDDPQGLRVRDVLEALVPIAWPGSRDACRDVLAKGTLEDASFAAQVLSVLKDEELARRIVARLPERPASSADGPWLWRLVGLLDGCDHARAATYAVRWKDEELFDHSYRETFRRIAAPSGPK